MSEKNKNQNIKTGYVALGVFLLCAAGGFYALSRKGEFFEVKKYEKNPEIAFLEEKIATLENKLENLEQGNISLKDLAALNQKIDRLQKVNEELLNAKASANALFGIVERLDRVESDIADLSKTTSQGALILTAAALTENAAKTGHPFIYEASVLQNLSEGTRFEQSADQIASYAIKGLMNKDQLIERFNTLYQSAFAAPQPQMQNNDVQKSEPESITDRIISKLRALVVIKKRQKSAEEIVAENMKDDIFALVQKGEFESAIVKMNAEPKYQTEAFEIWIEETRAEKNFIEQLNKIRALTLSMMKSTELKEKVQ